MMRAQPAVPPRLAKALSILPPCVVTEVMALLPVAPAIRAQAKTGSPEEIARMYAVSGLAVRVLIDNTEGTA